jgi:hypothetical protein
MVKDVPINVKEEKVMFCFHCGNKTLMQCVARYSHMSTDDENLVWFHQSWKLYFCPVCDDITLEQESTFSEDSDIDYDGNPKSKYRVLYPSITLEKNTPEKVRKAFEAALKVKDIDGATCLIALRRTLEMLCKDQGAKRGNLFNKLKQLSDTGVMPPIIDAMAVVLKNMGNKAAHADDHEFSPELVSSVIEFTQAILDYVYVLPAKLSAIQEQLNRSAADDEF